MSYSILFLPLFTFLTQHRYRLLAFSLTTFRDQIGSPWVLKPTSYFVRCDRKTHKQHLDLLNPEIPPAGCATRLQEQKEIRRIWSAATGWSIWLTRLCLLIIERRWSVAKKMKEVCAGSEEKNTFESVNGSSEALCGGKMRFLHVITADWSTTRSLIHGWQQPAINACQGVTS